MIRHTNNMICSLPADVISADSCIWISEYFQSDTQYLILWYIKLRIHNITAKAALKFENEAWVLNKKEEKRLEAAQMKFLRHLLRITILDIEKTMY